MDGSAGAEDRSLVEESRHIWDRNAEVWDSVMAAGRGWQKVFIGPVVERLLELRPGETVLDIACGNGIFSRRMAEMGAYVVAADFSPRLVELARSRTTEHADRIEYHVADATEEAQLVALGEGRFDAAVCSMALMDMPAIEPLYRAVSRMLKPGGRFVFSVSHPCFNTGYTTRMVEEDNSTGEVAHAIKVANYLSVHPSMGIALSEQPAKQYYWDRPISALLGAAFAAGLVLDALEEPPFKRDAPPTDRLDWANYDMPPVLFARLRLPG